MRMLTPYLQKNHIEIKEVLVGVMTGQAMDMMAEKGLRRKVPIFCRPYRYGSMNEIVIPSLAVIVSTTLITTVAMTETRLST